MLKAMKVSTQASFPYLIIVLSYIPFSLNSILLLFFPLFLAQKSHFSGVFVLLTVAFPFLERVE